MTYPEDDGTDTCLICGLVGQHSHPRPGHPVLEGAGYDCTCGECTTEGH